MDIEGATCSFVFLGLSTSYGGVTVEAMVKEIAWEMGDFVEVSNSWNIRMTRLFIEGSYPISVNVLIDFRLCPSYARYTNRI